MRFFLFGFGIPKSLFSVSIPLSRGKWMGSNSKFAFVDWQKLPECRQIKFGKFIENLNV